MKALSPFVLLSAALSSLAAASACTLVTDAGRFQNSDVAAVPNADYDQLNFLVKGMTSHVNERFEFRVVDANNFIQMRGVYETMGGLDTASTVVPAAIPHVGGPYHLDFYADHNSSGTYDAPPTDHAWRVEPLVDTRPVRTDNTGADGIVDVFYPHDYSFTDILSRPTGPGGAAVQDPPKDTGANATIKLTGMGAYIGKMVEVRVRDAASLHTVGLYRVTSASKDAFDMTVMGIIDGGENYFVDVYIDANGNKLYDAPVAGAGGSTTDRGFRIPRPSDANGLTLDFDPAQFPDQSFAVGAP